MQDHVKETGAQTDPASHASVVEEEQTTIIKKRKIVWTFVSANSKRIGPFLQATWRPMPSILLWLFIIVSFYVIFSMVAHSGWGLFHDFFKTIEWTGVVLSLAVTLYVYWMCSGREWLLQLPVTTQRWMFFPFFLATLASGGLCIASIGYRRTHLTCLTFYFIIFSVWDWRIWHMDKQKAACPDRVEEMETKAEHWFKYVDFPTPIFFWIIYALSRVSVHLSNSKDPYYSADSFLTGAIAATLLAQAWGWYLDCRHFLEHPINQTIFEEGSVQVVNTITQSGNMSNSQGGAQ